MGLKAYFGLAALVGILVGCGGGNNTNAPPVPEVPVALATPATAMVEVSGATTGQKVTISYSEQLDLQEAMKIEWRLNFEGSDLPIAVSADKLSADFIPTVSGRYEVIIFQGSEELRRIPVNVSMVIPYDLKNIEKIEDLADKVTNQYEFLATLDRDKITTVVAKYPKLTLLNIGAHGRFTIQLDVDNDESLSEFELLKLEPSISFIGNRLINRKIISDFTPNDGSKFDDHGDNWHLEDIQAVDAWSYSRGSGKVLIGVVDGGIFSKHEELIGKVSVINNIKGNGFNSDKTHGTAVSGVIAANTDNKKGISGINHVSKISFSSYNNNTNSADNFIGGCDSNARISSNSWGVDGKDRSSLSMSDLESRQVSIINALWDASRTSIGNLTACLTVKSAGNNYADARINGGALQYIVTGNKPQLDPLSNLLIVGAYIKESISSSRVLAVYSNYGESVEIAAPTEFKAPEDVDLVFDDYYEAKNGYGKSFSGGFNGTSAAAPVVSGVASLIFSLDPIFFTPAIVKKILIESAKKNGYITHREKTAGGALEKLVHPIPILNAAAALKMAQDELDARVVQSTAKIDQPSSGNMLLNLKVANGVIQSGSGTIAASANGCHLSTNTNSSYSKSFTVDANGVAQLPLTNTGVQCYKISGNVNIKVPSGANLSRPFELFKQVQSVKVNAKDQADLKAVTQAVVSIDSFTGQTQTDSQGTAWLWLEPGIHKIFVTKTAYKPFAQNLFINSGKVDVAIGSQGIDTFLTADAIKSAGALTGVVSDASGKPIPNATVRISGGDQTNGFFSSAVTNSKGEYSISNISRIDSTGKPIPSFLMVAFTSGYKASIRSKIVVLDGKTRNESFVLQVNPDAASKLVYSQSFEGGNDWALTGLWNQTTHTKNSIKNTLVDGGFSSLPPDELGSFAFLPVPQLGNGALWYGAANTGSFIGTQVAGDSAKNGGTSVSSNSGTATSSSISLATTTKPQLRFWTWWEIEGVNPNAAGFDHMDIQVSSNGGVSYTTVRRLNPSIDPNDADRNHKNFSSGGFNRKPVWTFEEIDLSAYSGKTIMIRFSFNTNDGAYNGFRGWLIDDVKIEEQ